MLKPRYQVALALVALAGASWLLEHYAPDATGPYPPCLLHAWTGLHCPGCGSTRALHALVHGKFGAAFGFNSLAMLFFTAMLPWTVRQGWLGLRHNQFATLALPPNTGWAVVWVVTGFTLARNLPWPPFSWLAPGAS
jgi:hypothetical protein